MKRAHREKLRMCDVLEEIADSLPDRIDRLKCIGMASALVPLLRSVHHYEEEMIFSGLRGRRGSACESQSSIRRLRAEHRRGRMLRRTR